MLFGERCTVYMVESAWVVTTTPGATNHRRQARIVEFYLDLVAHASLLPTAKSAKLVLLGSFEEGNTL